MLTIVRAGLRGTALGAVAYPSVDAETTPEGYCTCVRVRRLVVRRRYSSYTRKVRPPKASETLPAQRFSRAMTPPPPDP